jgi:hypothetical protein
MRKTLTLALVATAAALPLLALGLRPLGTVRAAGAQEAKKEARTAYVRRVYERDRASFGDACRMMLSLVADAPAEADFAKVRDELAGRGLVDAGWGLAEDANLTKGTLAYMLVKACGIKGGATMALFGTTRRYALREAVYVGLLEKGALDEHVGGRELIDAVTLAEVYRTEGSLDSVYR